MFSALLFTSDCILEMQQLKKSGVKSVGLNCLLHVAVQGGLKVWQRDEEQTGLHAQTHEVDLKEVKDFCKLSAEE